MWTEYIIFYHEVSFFLNNLFIIIISIQSWKLQVDENVYTTF